MEKIVNTLTSPATRMWAYNVMATVMTLLTVRGIIDGDEAAAILAVGAALFAVASVNTPRPEKDHEGRHEA
nr:MAG TPA: Mycobacterial 2 TMS Phage Holin (M2 Hol) Family [Caudoviricetes sp.]